MSDSDTFSRMQARSQAKRGSNREQSTKLLIDNGIVFESKNNGAHLIVQGNSCMIDFWPGTGRWIARTGEKGFGVFNLIEEVGNNHE